MNVILIEQRLAMSMKVFADGEPTFVYGHWKDWQAACQEEGRLIPPKEFKARYTTK